LLQATNEDTLVRRAQMGDVDAFEELIGAYQTALWNFAYTFLGNRDDVNDAVQQTLLKAFHGLGELQQSERFKAWLFTIARRACLDRLRRQHTVTFSEFSRHVGDHDAELEEDYGADQIFVDPAPLPPDILERKEAQQYVRAAILNLPPLARSVVTLRYAAELSFAEVAEALGLNENTTRTIFQRAKHQLRLDLQDKL
jgi:RNA polymerase sigma factor (sigma-70 family)